MSDSEKKPEVILMASGSEVPVCLEAQKLLDKKGVAARVVSVPSWELFEKTTSKYKEQVLPPGVAARVAVEAGISMGWGRYVGQGGAVVTIDRFGSSAPGGTVMKKYGITAANVVKKAMGLLNN